MKEQNDDAVDKLLDWIDGFISGDLSIEDVDFDKL